MKAPFVRFSVLVAAALLALGAGFGTRRLLRPNASETGNSSQHQDNADSGSAQQKGKPTVAAWSAASPWLRQLALNNLASTLRPGEWPAAMRELLEHDSAQADALLQRWLEVDLESALRFFASNLQGRQFRLECLQLVAHHLARANPGRGWNWAQSLDEQVGERFRAHLLASLCCQDPDGAARFIAAHAHSKFGSSDPISVLPALPDSAVQELVPRLAMAPDGPLKQTVLRSVVASWAQKDFAAALSWWRQQPAKVRGASLAGLGSALAGLADPDQNSTGNPFPNPFSIADLSLLSSTATEHSNSAESRAFINAFLLHLGASDPTAAAKWAAENSHGRHRPDGLDAAVSNATAEGALSVVKAWNFLPKSGWAGETLEGLATKAAQIDPKLTFEWAAALPASLRGDALGATGKTWTASDPDQARAAAAVLDPNSPIAASFAKGIAHGIYAPHGELDEGHEVNDARRREAWEWASSQTGQAGAAATSAVLDFWAESDPLAAGNAALQLPASESRSDQLRAIAGKFFSRDPKAMMQWAEALQPADREAALSALPPKEDQTLITPDQER